MMLFKKGSEGSGAPVRRAVGRYASAIKEMKEGKAL